MLRRPLLISDGPTNEYASCNQCGPQTCPTSSLRRCASLKSPAASRCAQWRAGAGALVHLVPGDVVMVRAGVGHDIVSSPNGPTRRSVSPAERPVYRTVSYHLGRGRPQCTFICGAVHFGGTAQHPLLTLLPEVLHVAADDAPDAAALLRQIDREASDGRPGSDLIVRHLSDIFFVRILRAWFESEPVGGGGWLAGATYKSVRRSAPFTRTRADTGACLRWHTNQRCPAHCLPSVSPACAASRHALRDTLASFARHGSPARWAPDRGKYRRERSRRHGRVAACRHCFELFSRSVSLPASLRH